MQKEDLYYIHICYVHVDKYSNIEKIKREKYFMKEVNKFPLDELKRVLKREIYQSQNRTKYYPFSIIKYNIVSNSDDTSQNLTSIKRIDTIYFEKTDQLYHDLNELIIIYHEYESPTVKEIIINRSKKCTRRSIESLVLPNVKKHRNTIKNTNIKNTNIKKIE
jgi:hypothetical protein